MKGRGTPQVRLRAGFILIAIVLSIFGARLVQLQAIDPHAYADAAREADLRTIDLPATRGQILDRNGEPLADSVAGLMVVADPALTKATAAPLAKFLSNKLGIDYFSTLTALRGKKENSRYEYVARRIPATKASEAVQAAEELGYEGLTTERDPIRNYPGGDLAANIVGFVGTDESLGGIERSFDATLAGKDGQETFVMAAGGTRVPLGESSTVAPINGQDITTTIDRDAQWYTSKVLAEAASNSGAESAIAVALDTRTGEVLALADWPTFDANNPSIAKKADRGARSLSDVYEPGSVQKVLTMSALIDAGKVTNRTKLTVPNTLSRQDRTIHDWFDHPTKRWTLAGVMAQSSNIGTVLASDKFEKGQLRSYLARFGLGQRTGLGLSGESAGILASDAAWNSQIQDRITFGQSVSVNAVQMAAAVNAVANGGVKVSPSLIKGSATNAAGQLVGTDHATTERVVSAEAARQTMQMMERVVDPATGTAAKARVAGYRVAGKTGTAQRANAKLGRYDGTLTVSFGGFAPADDPRFTVYVVVQNPKTNQGGGSNAGPVFSRIMSFLLRRYGVAPTGTKPSHLPVEWGKGALKY